MTILIRWRMGCDSSADRDYPWHVDDISISNTQIPDSCTTANIFGDGFESGDTSSWSTVIP